MAMWLEHKSINARLGLKKPNISAVTLSAHADGVIADPRAV